MNLSKMLRYSLLLCLTFMSVCLFAQKKKAKEEEKKEKTALEKLSVSGLKFRSVGPALTSGRISDFAVNPEKPHEYYVATSSGGVWKTINSGITYQPIFDRQGSYSIGCVSLDPNNSDVVWVGTGENNNQRSVAYGDGIYKSSDGGKSWKHMGLKESEHIGSIIVHPDNSDKVFVAAIGPLWKEGGERGVFMSQDGGENWENVLPIDAHTGINEMVMDPSNPDIMYASAFQRRRHVFTYLGGGPNSGIYKSTDGGMTWEKANKGLPGVDKGRIGLSISPANPDILYAIVEAAQGKSGFYKSVDGAASWQKQSSFVTSGNYYQEIIADPVDAHTVYAMDTWMKISTDGGKSFKNVGEDFKHVDNHCIWIDPTYNQHILVGCDGGIYESWDRGKAWDFKANLPITQFYKVALDNDEPFYHIYGGTQDNFSLGGPSRVITDHGIRNEEWFITHGGDGFESQVDPENPDIVYAQSQYGVLVRYDRKSGEEVGIQPKERKGENAYRWNWDAPLQVSAHKSGRLYFSANKVFKSDDYGNSWEVLSDDLSRQVNRNELEVMDRVWSFEAVAKNRSTSPYGTIVAFCESPVDENLLVAGTDDGLIHITADGGKSWRKVDNIPGVPARTYVNNVYASQHDKNVIYAAFNHHKYGDFKPYMYKSTDLGNSWTSISNNLPERGSVYAIEEDHVAEGLIFCGTEFGVFFSPDGGEEWKQLKAGVPVIAVRDLAIQRRENDLVLGTFGRGFYVLDDYSPLRSISEEMMEKEGMLLATRDALMFEKSTPLGLPGKAFQGDSYYTGENLGPEAIFTYYLREKVSTSKDERRKKEKEEAKDGGSNAYPTYDELLAETDEISPKVVFTIKDGEGKVVKKLSKSPAKGVQRIHWDLRYASKAPIRLSSGGFYNPFSGKREGSLVSPGTYTVAMSLYKEGEMSSMGEPVSFQVKALNNTVLPAEDRMAKVAFQRKVTELSRSISGAQLLIREMENKLKHIQLAIQEVEEPMGDLVAEANGISTKITSLKRQLNGNRVKSRLDIEEPPTPAGRIGWISYEQKYSTSSPTKTHMDSFAIAEEEFQPILIALKKLANEDMEALEKKLEDADAPYTPGRAIKMMQGN
ncbi:MAG: glycosyl hydrolase [Bacteroidota bacterium]